MGLLGPRALLGLFKYSKTVSVLAKLVDLGWLMLDPHPARGSSGVVKVFMERGKGWGNRDKIFPDRREQRGCWGSGGALCWDGTCWGSPAHCIHIPDLSPLPISTKPLFHIGTTLLHYPIRSTVSIQRWPEGSWRRIRSRGTAFARKASCCCYY